jgi:hypothetical protein
MGTQGMVIDQVVLITGWPVLLMVLEFLISMVGAVLILSINIIIMIIMVMAMLVMVFIIVVIILIVMVMTMVFMRVIMLVQQHPVPVCRFYVTRTLRLGCWQRRTDVIHNCGLELVQPPARHEE